MSAEDGSLMEHKWFTHSMSPVNLAEIEILEVSSYDLLVIQLHGNFFSLTAINASFCSGLWVGLQKRKLIFPDIQPSFVTLMLIIIIYFIQFSIILTYSLNIFMYFL